MDSRLAGRAPTNRVGLQGLQPRRSRQALRRIGGAVSGVFFLPVAYAEKPLDRFNGERSWEEVAMRKIVAKLGFM